MAAVDVAAPTLLRETFAERPGDLGAPRFAVTSNKRRKLSSSTPVPLTSEYCSQNEAASYDSENESSNDLTETNLVKKHPSDLNKIHACPYESCEKSFNRPARLEEHLRSHTNTRPFKCAHSGCVKSFLRQSHLAHHTKSAHSGVRDYACSWPDCEKMFLTATRLKRHLAAHEGNEKFKCRDYPPCEKSFRKHTTLQRHIDIDHLNQKPFPCDIKDRVSNQPCMAAYDSAAKLHAHKQKSHGETRYQCSFCVTEATTADRLVESTTFTSYADLQAHVKLAHPPQCRYCNQRFTFSNQLQNHIEIHHSGIEVDHRKTFICTKDGCGKGFTKPGNLKIHVRSVHKQEKPFKCGETDLSQSSELAAWNRNDGCGQSFTAKASLESHVKTQHLGLGKPNKRIERKIRRSRKQLNASCTASSLTGMIDQDASSKESPCILPGCKISFVHQLDLVNHAMQDHSMSERDVYEALAEVEALTGGTFWIGGDEDGEGNVAVSEGDTPPFWHESAELEAFWLPASNGWPTGLESPGFNGSQGEVPDGGNTEHFIDPYLMDLQSVDPQSNGAAQ